MFGQSHLLVSDKKEKTEQKMSERASLSSNQVQQGQSRYSSVPDSQPLLPASCDIRNLKEYPQPIATYEEVVEDAAIFKESHDLFFTMLGISVVVPKIGEDDLDLHRLFKEVTSRGGFDQITLDLKWNEVAISYGLPLTPTIDIPSSFLRVHYMSWLYHYEQVYYFRKKVLAPGALSVPATTSMENIHESTRGVAPIADQPFAGLVGSTLSGTIQGKCENGYFVSVDLGYDRLDGVLFPVQDETPKTQISETQPDIDSRQGVKRIQPDPNRPKANRSAYSFFVAEQFPKLKHVYKGGVRTLTKVIADLWNNLPEDEKQPYRDMAADDKARYKGELQEYKALHTSNAH